MEILSGFILIKGISFLMFSSFICIFFGLLIGRITIKGISLGSSGVFIIALLYGALFSSHIKSTISQKTSDNKSIDISSNGLKILENIGLILFIGSVGFISGPNFFTSLKKNFKSYLLVGLLVILCSTLVCVVIFYSAKKSEKNIDEFNTMMVGIFAGALTSTPAFSAAKASADDEYESAVTVGYGLAYIFGVLGVVLFVQIVPKIMNVDMDIERELIMDKEYKITKRVGTDRTDQTEGTKISRSLSGDIQKTDRINIIKSDKKDSIDDIVKVNKQDTNNKKKSKFFLAVKGKKEKQSHSRNEEKENIEFEIKSNSINTKGNMITSQMSEIDKEKQSDNYIIEETKEKGDNNQEEKDNENNNQEEKENEDNNQEEKENEDNNQEEKENDDNNQEEKENEDNNQEEKEIPERMKKPEKLFTLDKYGFCVFGFGSLVGIFIGAIRIPLSKEGFNGSAFSLTTTGGVLLTCLVLGHIGKIKKLSLKVDKKVLENLRELGLILFLMGSGIAGGTKFIEYFKVIYFFYGILITLFPLIIGFFFNKYVLKLCLLNNLGSLTGAMTSTPALGTLISVAKTDSIGNPYAATYPISLISVVLSAQFMVLLMK